MVHPGLEEVAAEEIRAERGGDVKRAARGIVVFRLDEIDRSILQLRTTEDVLLHAWGTDQLTYRAADLDSIRRWTAKDADWNQLLQLHHAIRPKPKGKPTYRLVVQMTGTHGYRRVDARKALAHVLAGKFPASWRPAEEDAAGAGWIMISEVHAPILAAIIIDEPAGHGDHRRVDHANVVAENGPHLRIGRGDSNGFG